MTDSLIVSEVFGPTWQGEGPSLGRRAAFVRLGRCNLACSWCDTPYTWDWDRFDPAEELETRSVEEIAAAVDAMEAQLVVVTGGEPLLQQRHLPPLLSRLRASRHQVEVETAGTIEPAAEIVDLVDRFNVSPKLANSGNRRDRRYKPEVLRQFAATGKAAFKFVAATVADLDEVASIVEECDLAEVWIMPEGTDSATIVERSRALADEVLDRGWHLTSRLHVLLWGDQRGR